MSTDDNDKSAKPRLVILDGECNLSEEEQAAIIEELAELKASKSILYDREKKKAAVQLKVTVKAVEDAVRQAKAALEDQEAAAELVNIAITKATLWQSEDRAPYATITVDGHLEHYAVEADGFQDWLSDQYGEMHQREINGELLPVYPRREDLKEATHQICTYARRRGRVYTPRVRLNHHDDALWLDLGGLDWRGVRITAEGWSVVDRITAPIIRTNGIRPLPAPVPGGNIHDLRQFVNLDDEHFVLFCGVAASLLNTFGNYTTTIFCGPAGSGKTTATRIMRRLVDPHRVETQPFHSVRDLMHSATHIIALENMSSISDDLSDAICRLNTGTGYAERQYYAQGKQYQSSLHCPVLINGIPGNLATREDLADRTITFGFPLLGDRVLSDDLLWQRFDAALPQLLGALLDGAVGALRSRQAFGKNNDAAAAALLSGWRPRFVDFAVWGEAACRAMGFADGEFASAYRHNLGYALRYLAEHNPVCVGIRKLIDAVDEWSGYPEDLLKAIRPYCHGLDTKLRSAVWLSREDLPRAIPLLAKVHGITVRTNRRLAQNDNRNGIEIGRGTYSDPELSSDDAPSDDA
jgi:hypothetical protein